MKSSTRHFTLNTCVLLLLFLMSTFVKAQTIFFSDGAEASNGPVIGGSNQYSTWSNKNTYYANASTLNRSTNFKRAGAYSYYMRLNDIGVDGWQAVKTELGYGFVPAGSPTYSGISGNNRAPVGLVWMSASILIPSTSKDDITITEIAFDTKCWPDDYTTPTYLATENGRYKLYLTKVNSSEQVTGVNTYDCGPVVKDQWEDWVMNRNYTPNDSGYVRLYKNGVKVVEYLGGNFKLTGHAKEAYYQHGLYKWSFQSGWPSAGTTFTEMYLDEVKFGGYGNTLASMSPAGTTVPSNSPPKVTVTTPITTTLTSIQVTGTGTDADGTIASYKWTQSSGPNTATITNGNTATATFSNLIQGTYTFLITVTDNAGATGTATVSVTVNSQPINQAPVANAGSNKTITLPINSTQLTGSGTDSDGTITAFNWTQVSGPATATISGANTANATMGDLVQGIYTFRLRVTDNDGATHTDDVTVTVNAAPVANIAPVANAGSNKNITLPTNSTVLTGSGTDADGTITAYNWSQVSGPATATISNSNATSSTMGNLIQGLYTFRLRVTDNDGATHTDDVNVTVNAAPVANLAPVANAGRNQTITLPTNSVTVTGSGSDNDGTISAFRWTQTAGPNTATIANNSTASTSISGMAKGIYTFMLTVTDNQGATGTDEISITVNDIVVANQVPVANAGGNKSINLPTSSVSINGSGTDVDGTIASYKWTEVSGPNSATISGSNQASVNFSGLALGTYTFRLTVTDNDGATDVDDVTVSVNAEIVPNLAPVANAGANQTITLPDNSITITGSGTDSDGTIGSYSWTQVTGPNTAVIGSTNQASTVFSGLVEGTYTFRITVIDNEGASDADDVNVVVNPGQAPNIAPLANSGDNQSITLPTNSLTITGSGTDNDGTITAYGWRQVSGPNSAVIGTNNAASSTFSGLIEGLYTFRLTVTDNDGATNSDDVFVTVNPAPAAPLKRAPIAKAGGKKTVSSTSTQITAAASYDTDGQITTYTWTQVSGPNKANISNPKAATANLSNLVPGTYNFKLEVIDNDGLKGSEILTLLVTIPPVAKAGADITITLPTNTATLNGSTSSDPDGTIQAYSWSQVTGPKISTISSASSARTNVNSLATGVYEFKLEVTDNNGLKDADTVKVTVKPEPVNKVPVIVTSTNIELTMPTDSVSLDGSKSYDLDGTIKLHQWKLVNGPSTPVLSNQNKSIATARNLVAGIYTFQILVRDDKGATVTKEVSVSVIGNNSLSNVSMKLYPNPVASNGLVNLRIDDNNTGKAIVRVYNMNGVIVHQEELNKQNTQLTKTINVGNLPSATYVMSVQFENKKPVVTKFQKL
ncbi:PKD domain-containing protein [Flavihumibacter fluvii]|uniref:PKD domain-containing protein n=1 Tax=Flavihumibacter fluvii TaxID=2838157 RepID=UPI001BDF2D15|nr:tandem-95 repeat protein [Flavihumibacter fluvii]ULQ54445.1 tandem-95 repeat protein [Flavihumibacter fluvii]